MLDLDTIGYFLYIEDRERQAAIRKELNELTALLDAGIITQWTDIVAVSVGRHHMIGLRSDGTVAATGRNDWGQCDVDDWTDIKKP